MIVVGVVALIFEATGIRLGLSLPRICVHILCMRL